LKRWEDEKLDDSINSKEDINWLHPGGKLIEEGAHKLSDAELLSIIISPGVRGIKAEQLAENILNEFGSFRGIASQPLEKFLGFKGLGDVKIIRIAAVFEIARRITDEVLKEYEEEQNNR
jgi:DNA repair protein RadC